MQIGIDIREACRPNKVGKGQWTAGFVQELLKRSIPLTLFSDVPIPKEFQAAHVTPVELPERGFAWHRAVARMVRSREAAISLYVSPTSYIVPALVGRKKPCAVVVHDLIAFQDEPHDKKAMRIEQWTLWRVVRTAAVLLPVSESTKQDLQTRYTHLKPERIAVVYAGPMRENPTKNAGDRKTILCVGTLCPRKNQERLVLAYKRLDPEIRAQYDLILVGGRGWDDEKILETAKKTTNVHWADYLSDNEYQDLLTHCALLALPSLYEGFGMQVLDALQCGMPVLTSKNGSLAEVAGDAALLVDPLNVQSIADGLTRILSDAALREQLHAKGPVQAARFSWKKTVDLFLQAVGIGEGKHSS